MMEPPVVQRRSIDELNEQRQRNRRVRAEQLLALHNGVLVLADVLELAATPEGAPLRTVRLTDLLSSMPGWSKRRAEGAVEWARDNLGVDPEYPDRKMNIGWLIHAQAAHKRGVALSDAMTRDRRTAPHDRYPF